MGSSVEKRESSFVLAAFFRKKKLAHMARGEINRRVVRSVCRPFKGESFHVRVACARGTSLWQNASLPLRPDNVSFPALFLPRSTRAQSRRAAAISQQKLAPSFDTDPDGINCFARAAVLAQGKMESRCSNLMETLRCNLWGADFPAAVELTKIIEPLGLSEFFRRGSMTPAPLVAVSSHER